MLLLLALLLLFDESNFIGGELSSKVFKTDGVIGTSSIANSFDSKSFFTSRWLPMIVEGLMLPLLILILLLLLLFKQTQFRIEFRNRSFSATRLKNHNVLIIHSKTQWQKNYFRYAVSNWFTSSVFNEAKVKKIKSFFLIL